MDTYRMCVGIIGHNMVANISHENFTWIKCYTSLCRQKCENPLLWMDDLLSPLETTDSDSSTIIPQNPLSNCLYDFQCPENLFMAEDEGKLQELRRRWKEIRGNSRMLNARLPLSNIRRLRNQYCIRASTKGRAHITVVRSVLPYGSETWP